MKLSLFAAHASLSLFVFGDAVRWIAADRLAEGSERDEGCLSREKLEGEMEEVECVSGVCAS